jgi:hypothetical protein
MFMRTLLTLALATAAFAQPISYPVVQLQSGLRVAGTVERDDSGVWWLRTPAGSRLLIGSSLTYYDASNAPLTYATLSPGSAVTVEYPSGETRVIAMRGETVTLLSPSGVTQVPLTLLPAGVITTTTVLPESGWAIIGGKAVNFMPYMTFTGGITEYGTVQKKEEIKGTQEVYVLTGRGENLAVPVKWINGGGTSWGDVNIGDRVSVDIPSGTTVQLREMFGRSAQFRTQDGKLLQLPFAVVPDDVLEATQVGVRRLNGDIEVMALSKALAGDQSRAHMILLPGVPGVSYVMATTGVYIVEVK